MIATQRLEEILVYVGTYTRSWSEGIYVYRLDLSSGALRCVSKVTGVENPSFLALHPHGAYLYSVNESVERADHSGGAVSAFAIDSQTGKLAFLNEQPSQGTYACHLSIDETGRWVLVANYGGSLTVLPVRPDGGLGQAVDLVEYRLAGISLGQEKVSHVHSVILDPAKLFTLVADAGLDRIMIYQLDPTLGKLRPQRKSWVEVTPGAGPRHMDFHPNGRYLYVINETDSTVSLFAYDQSDGSLRELQKISTLPQGFRGTNHCADIHVHPSGRFVYGSNRGHDSIAMFAVDGETGGLTCFGQEPTQGRTPRNFAIDPTGTFLLAANQDSDSIITFRIDRQSGRLMPTEHVAQVPMPVCVQMPPLV